MTSKKRYEGDPPAPEPDRATDNKKVYVSAVDRTMYEIHRTAHHADGEKSITLTDDEFVFAMRVLAEYKKLLKMVIAKYTEDEIKARK